MDINSAQRVGISLRALAAAGALVFLLSACGEKSPPPPRPQAASPAPDAPQPQPQGQPAPTQAAAPAAAEEKPDPDKALTKKVQSSLRASLGSVADGIDVTASHGKVTLWGTVPEAAKRGQAMRSAAGVAGVKSVSDNMAIVSGS